MGKIFSKISKWVYTKVKIFVSPILGLYYDGKKTVYQQPNTSTGESFVTSSRMEKMSQMKEGKESCCKRGGLSFLVRGFMIKKCKLLLLTT